MARTPWLLVALLILAATGTAQHRYLISPEEELIPILPGEDAATMVRQFGCPASEPFIPPCDTLFAIDDPWPVMGYAVSRHKDVMGQWYVAKAPGTIDTIFFEIAGMGDWLLDSTVYVRIHRSNIGPDYGPGIRPGPFDPPCQLWGYWINTNDIDRGITAFPEDATDTTWISTYSGPGVISTPPIGEPLWGSGGYPVKLKPNGVNFAAVDLLGPIPVDIGDKLFISVELSYDQPWFPDEENPTQFLFCRKTTTTWDEFYPSRNWKFYEHERGPSDCAGLPLDSMKSGWYARGALTGDSLDVALWNIWYTMTVSGNAPPVFVSFEALKNTFNTDPRPVQAVIEDCYSEDPGQSGIASAMLVYEVDGVQQTPLPMTYIAADTWEATIPGQSPGSRVIYRVDATDLEGVSASGPTAEYSVVQFGNAWYALDTGYACAPHDIGSSGTAVDAGSFFLPPSAPASASALDDGTSGPYDMGGFVYLFNDWFRYAWIGVNGGIALSKSPADTQDVNSNGLCLAPGESPWDFPGRQKQGREDWSAGRMPGMFIAPFWADHILQDSAATYGRILVGDDGDTCLFIVEWDSIGNRVFSTPWQDGTTFRVVLNRCTGTVEFQYDEIGDWNDTPPWNPDAPMLSGMQADSNAVSGTDPGYVLLARNGYPMEIAPFDGRCIRMTPTVGFLAASGWNQMAVSMAPHDGDYHQSSLFPGTGRAWTWQTDGGYGDPLDDPLMSPGKGFWMKLDHPGRTGLRRGAFISELTVPVQNGWNMIGGPSGYVNTHDIIPSPGGPSGWSEFFGYGNDGFYPEEFLEPGRGYWVKVYGPTDWFLLKSSPPIPAVAGSRLKQMIAAWNSVTIRDVKGYSQTLYLAPDRSVAADPRSFELPPAAPRGMFDARFGDGTMVGIYPSVPEASRIYDFPVTISGAEYPLTVTWEIQDPPPGGRRIELRTGAGSSDVSGGARTPVEGSGSLTIGDPSVRTIVLSIRADHDIPAEFSLGPNYPNPFNSSTLVRFSLPREGRVLLRVYDLLGRAVRTLVDEELTAGTHTAAWDGTDDRSAVTTSGVFILRITAGDFTASRKLLLIK